MFVIWDMTLHIVFVMELELNIFLDYQHLLYYSLRFVYTRIQQTGYIAFKYEIRVYFDNNIILVVRWSIRHYPVEGWVYRVGDILRNLCHLHNYLDECNFLINYDTPFICMHGEYSAACLSKYCLVNVIVLFFLKHIKLKLSNCGKNWKFLVAAVKKNHNVPIKISHTGIAMSYLF